MQPTHKENQQFHRGLRQIQNESTQCQPLDSNQHSHPAFPLNSLILQSLIGRGANGKVFRVLHPINSSFFAMKRIKLNIRQNWRSKLQKLLNQVSLLKLLDHPNIIRYIGSQKSVNSPLTAEVRIYMQYMQGESLASILQSFGPLSKKLTKKYSIQILNGLLYLHSRGILHRDLKCANILALKDGTVKLADFGASKYIKGLSLVSKNSELCQTIRGSPYWMAPEILRGERYGRKVDIWSFGCLVLQMLTGQHPWSKIYQYDDLYAAILSEQKPDMPSNISDACRDFINRCLEYDKASRASVGELITHRFLNQPIQNCS